MLAVAIGAGFSYDSVMAKILFIDEDDQGNTTYTIVRFDVKITKSNNLRCIWYYRSFHLN